MRHLSARGVLLLLIVISQAVFVAAPIPAQEPPIAWGAPGVPQGLCAGVQALKPDDPRVLRALLKNTGPASLSVELYRCSLDWKVVFQMAGGSSRTFVTEDSRMYDSSMLSSTVVLESGETLFQTIDATGQSWVLKPVDPKSLTFLESAPALTKLPPGTYSVFLEFSGVDSFSRGPITARTGSLSFSIGE